MKAIHLILLLLLQATGKTIHTQTHTHTDLITNRLARQTLKIAQSVFHDNMDHCVPTSGDVVGRTHSLPQLT